MKSLYHKLDKNLQNGKIIKVKIDSIYPLSEGQKGLWSLQKISQGITAYNIPVAFRIKKCISIENLKLAFEFLLQQYPILKTVIEEKSGIPYQRINHNQKLFFKYEVISSLLSEEEVKVFLSNFIKEPFFLKSGPLMRVNLFSCPDNSHILLINFHHIICDGLSIEFFMATLLNTYQSLVETDSFPNLVFQKVSYIDFVRWEQDFLNSVEGDRCKAYWMKQLSGELSMLSLPMDYPRPVIGRFIGKTCQVDLDIALSKKLEQLRANQRTSFAVLFLGIFKTLIYKYTGQEDILVGLPTAMRSKPEFEKLFGYLINMMVVRSQPKTEKIFTSYLKEIQSNIFHALEYSGYPFSKIVADLGIQPNLSVSPIFQVSYNYQGGALDEVVEDFAHCKKNLNLALLDFVHQEGEYDLSLEVFEKLDHFSLVFKYNPDLFDKSTIECFLGHYIQLATEVASVPDKRLSDYALLTPLEKQTLLSDWNNTQADYPDTQCLHELFEAQARRTPDTIAVSYEDDALTYEELDRQSTTLAKYLQNKGVKPNNLVALCLERSLEMLVGLLGVLKAGSAYVPLDPEYPDDRLAYMLSDSQSCILLSQAALSEKVEGLAQNKIDIVYLDQGWNDIESNAKIGKDLNQHVQSNDLAYVIYTSGSTGHPKGVMIEHRSLVNFLISMTSEPGFAPGDRLLSVTSYGFDIAGLELYLPLVNGGHCIICPQEKARDVSLLCEEIKRLKPKLMQATPATWLTLFQSGWDNTEQIKILCGGEALSESLRTYFIQTHSKVWNMYGPTETTIWSMVQQVEKDGSITIGKPINNTEVYILDHQLGLLPIGVSGELCISGDGLARGYLNQPELTAEKFVDHPFIEGKKIYRSGDLARCLKDGTIEYLGRMDDQIKLRGFRIELGEIESRLNQHPGIKNSTVIIKTQEENQYLVAYYTIDKILTENAIDTADVRAFLSQTLPDYMIPAGFVVLDDIPLTPNGKVDRKLLSQQSFDLQSTQSYEAPRNPIEEQLSLIWQEVLKVERVGIHDNFFELGGHSLLAVHLIGLVQSRLQKDVPLNCLMSGPTIENLANYLQNTEETAEPLPQVEVDISNLHKPFPLTDVQQAYWLGRSSVFSLGNVSTHTYFELSIYHLDYPHLLSAWNRLIRRHDMLRCIFLNEKEQKILETVPEYVIRHLDLSDESTDVFEQSLLSIRDEMSHQLFESDQWPLFDIRVTKKTEELSYFHFSIDLLIADVGSLYKLLGELESLYLSPEDKLAPYTLSFRDYRLAEEKIKETGYYKRSRNYWLQRLENFPRAPSLPLVKDPSDVVNPRFNRRCFVLQEAQWEQLKRSVSKLGTTPSVFLIAAFSEILYRWSKQSDFTLNLTLFNRLPLHPQVKDLVGDFTSLTLLAIHNGERQSLVEKAKAIQQQLWNDVEHRYFSGVEVLRELNRHSSSAQTVMMPVVFTSALGLDTDVSDESLEQKASLFHCYEYDISQTSQVWLDHMVSEDEGRLILTWDAIEDLFPAGLLDDMFNAYTQLLERLVFDEDTGWDEALETPLPKLQQQQRAQVNATEAFYPKVLLQDLFLEQAQQTPEAIALISSEEQLNYSQLNDHAQALGNQLRLAGAQSNQLIAVVMEKGWEQVVSVLGILYSGAAYLPIDANQPGERIHRLLEQGEVSLIVTQSQYEESLNWPNHIQVIGIDQTRLAQWSSAELPSVQAVSDLAYVIFTSGSTGMPKGVMIDHRGAVNTVLDINQKFEVTSVDKVLALSALNFDLSVYDIFGVLGAGGTIVLPEAGKEKDPQHWAELVHRYGVTLWNSVPALMQLYMDELESQQAPLLDSMRLVMLSGDWIPLNLPSRIKEQCSNTVSVISLGGATEASIWSIYHRIKRLDPLWTSIPYGTPLSNQSFHVLKPDLSDCPDWVAGDLYIGGIGLAQGYWKDEEKTNNSFIIHPQTRERLYKTGDRGRYWPDGRLEFLGREDNQVKVQGHRIELGEIEAVLNQHPDVQYSVVIAFGEAMENKRLIGYVVPKDKIKPNAITDLAWRDFLLERLPDYMVPTVFVDLLELPLTTNGKVDRGSLPIPDFADQIQKKYVAPRSFIEAQLVDLWCEILQLKQVGVYDNFFELGGHSILAVQLVALIQNHLQRKVPLNQLFDAPTIANMAKYLEHSAEAIESLPVIVADKSNLYEPFPLTDVQQAYWLGRSNAFSLGNISTHVYFELSMKDLDYDRFVLSWNYLIRHHAMLRCIFLNEQKQQILESVPEYTIEYMDLSQETKTVSEEKLSTLRDEMSHQVFSVDQWPLFDIRITQISEKISYFHFSMDLLIADGRSLNKLLEDLEKLYFNPRMNLPAYEISFRDYLIAEQKIKDSSYYQRSRDYWFQRLEDFPDAPSLPLVRDPMTIVRPKFSRRQFVLEQDQWRILKNKINDIGITPSVFLLTIFSEVLYRWSKPQDFTLSLTLFNRLPLHEQVNDLVGDFTSLTLLTINNDTEQSFLEKLQKIQRQLLSDVEHRYFSGIEMLRELTHRAPNNQTVMMPVVFTSVLGLTNEDAMDERSKHRLFDEVNYEITQTSQIWLDHSVMEWQGKLTLAWDVIEELFPENLLDDMFATYTSLLQSFINDDEWSWDKPLPIVLPVYQQCQREELNRMDVACSPLLLHESFQAQALNQPNKLAIISSDQQLNYGELHQYAHKLAHYLRERGAKANKLIGIVMEKGWEQVVSVMGILYSGAAYLPIDAGQPEERIKQLLEQGEVSIVLTQAQSREKLKGSNDLHIVVIDPVNLQDLPQLEVSSVQKPENLAYVIFTSGSTGIPKGVMIDHRGAVNTIEDINNKFNVTANDCGIALSSLNFDLSVYDIFGLLSAGGTLVILDAEQERDPQHWVELMNSHRVTIWNSVPALMQLYIEELESQASNLPESLRLVLMSGDWIPLNLPDRIRARSVVDNSLSIISLGGATEASIWSIYHPIEVLLSDWKSIPYGKPLLNQSFYVLTPSLSDCPDWVVGDLYIGGIGLAQGYWRDEEKTAKSFIIHPASGERLYKTGDRGRYRPDGNIEFLGREDNQVKVQGHRIELGEIEAVLNQHPDVQDSVVMAFGEAMTAKRLAAYIVSSDTSISTLPDYNPYEHQLLTPEDENIITDSVSRIEFKLKQSGLRWWNTNKNSLALALSEHLSINTPHYPGSWMDWDIEAAHDLNYVNFSYMLQMLSQVPSEESPLPKRRYPSAGSLYPVQAYIYLKRDVKNIDKGFYYYDPARHELIKITLDSKDNNVAINKTFSTESVKFIDANFVLFLVADYQAIKPLYGNMSKAFCLIEAGYISQLLFSGALYEGIGLTPIKLDEVSGIIKCFDLSSDHQVLYGLVDRNTDRDQPISQDFKSVSVLNDKLFNECFSIPLTNDQKYQPLSVGLWARQSYRNFDNKIISIKQLSVLLNYIISPVVEIYLYFKDGCVENLVGGCYIYDQKNKCLVQANKKSFSKLYNNSNQSIFDKAAFGIFFVGSVSEENLIASGVLGQSLMLQAPKALLGLCPIGAINEIKSYEHFLLNKNKKILHSFLGGSITAEQTECWGIRGIEPEPEGKKYSSFLSYRLPKYMLPLIYTELKSFPLTANGKVNRQALPPPDFCSDKSNIFIPPDSDTEKLMAELWNEILKLNKKISVEDNFFQIGGDSLLAIQLVTKIKNATNNKISLRILFENPTIKALALHIDKMCDMDEPGSIFETIEPDEKNRYQPFPLTDIQQAYWIGRSSAFQMGNIATYGYHEVEYYDLNIEHYEWALNYLIKRHDMLRMIICEDGQQRCLEAVPNYKVEYQDLSEMTDGDRNQALLITRESMSHQVLDPEKWPLFDIRISRIDSKMYRMHFGIDLLIMDVWSALIFFHELDVIYTNEKITLPPLDITFREYVLFERKHRNSKLYQQAKTYWLSRVDTLPSAPLLPLYKDPLHVAKPSFKHREYLLNQDLWKKLEYTAQNYKVSSSVLIATAFSYVLSNWSLNNHFTLNLTLFNRLPFHDQVNDLIGDFTSSILLEVNLTEGKKFKDTLKSLQEQLLDDIENRYFSGVEMIRELSRKQGSQVFMPVVFTSALGLSQQKDKKLKEINNEAKTLVGDVVYSISQTSQVWLDHVVMEEEGGLLFTWDAVEELFPSGMLDDMFTTYCNLLHELANTDVLIEKNFPLALPLHQERQRKLVNKTVAAYSSKLLHELFRSQVLRHPDQLAIISSNQQLSYDELHEHAHKLGYYLRERGAQPNELIGIVMEKGWEQVVSVLGILYSGAAYLPIDAGQPEERIKQLLDQGEVRLILAQKQSLEKLSGFVEEDIFVINAANLQDLPPAELDFIQKPNDLAYVIFTSGSTGIPKGVMIDHRGAVNTIEDINKKFYVAENDRAIALSSLNFDLSVYDIFGLLSAGGTLVIPDAARERDPQYWVELMVAHQVTIWNSVPALMQLYIEELELQGRDLPSVLRLVLMSGDWIPLSLPDRIKSRSLDNSLSVISLGGATEASIWSIYYPIIGVKKDWKSIPYGKPLSNQSFHVLKLDLSDCPDWVAGDLYIGGVGLAQGYWRDEEKTQKSFIIHPVNGERLYKTGDRGRYRPDGNIEFLGREDNQVKVQGHRIELGEIESVLNRHRDVQDSVVMAFGEAMENKRLVAYVVSKDKKDLEGFYYSNNHTSIELLTDSVERTAFKLQENGLRKFEKFLFSVNLKSRPNIDTHLDLILYNHHSYIDLRKPINFQSFSRWLSCLAQVNVRDHLSAKRYYPSAGTLYPVQAYLYVKSGWVNEVQSGFYYYDPAGNRLILLASTIDSINGEDLDNICDEESAFSVFLVSDNKAIVPIYGDMAEKFSFIEAGHIGQLLTSAALAQGFSLSLKQNKNFQKLCGFLNLSPYHCLLKTFEGKSITLSKKEKLIQHNPIERQSYRKFSKQIIPSNKLIELMRVFSKENTWDELSEISNEKIFETTLPKLYLLIKPKKVEDFSGGLYNYNSEFGELTQITSSTLSEFHLYGGYNEDVYKESAFSIFMIGDIKNKSSLYLAGLLGQRLMSVAHTYGMGLCPIGSMEFNKVSEVLKLDNTENLLYSFLGGSVTEVQTKSWPVQSGSKLENKDKIWRKFLSERLPPYMVPNIFFNLEKLPLTTNGKINRSALVEPELSRNIKEEKNPPTTENEKKLVVIWSKVLGVESIDISRTFFEQGGDSILMIKTRRMIEDVLDVSISVTNLFEYPTIQNLAKYLSNIKLKDASNIVKKRQKRRVKTKEKDFLS